MRVFQQPARRFCILQGIKYPVLVAPKKENGSNVLPSAAAQYISEMLDLEFDTGVIQLPGGKRKEARSLNRLFNFPRFAGEVRRGRHYIAFDDMIGTGATLAEIRSYILKNGGKYAFSCCLASASGEDHLINNTPEQVSRIINSLGQTLSDWFEKKAGTGLQTLTRVESFLLIDEKIKCELRQQYLTPEKLFL
jgi:hypothetical protein